MDTSEYQPETELEEKFKTRDEEYESDFETEFELGDGPDIWELSDIKETILSHPEGSFLALVNDKSEQNISALLEKKIKEESNEINALTLDSILPEVSFMTQENTFLQHFRMVSSKP